MSKRKLTMKYLVLKMEDRIDLKKLFKSQTLQAIYIPNYAPKIRDIAQDILDCLIEEEEKRR